MSRNSDHIRVFIKENHTVLTITEMAKACNISSPAISVHCTQMGITPITHKEKTIQFIKEHPTWKPEEIAEALGGTTQGIRNLISREKLRPKPTLSATLSVAAYKAKIKLKTSETEELPSPHEVEQIKKMEEASQKIKADRKSFNALTQTHSPYGLADKLRGVVTTKDPQPFYPEIVRL